MGVSLSDSFFVTVFKYKQLNNNDIEIFLVYIMYVLSFPLGFIFSTALAAIIYGILWLFNLLDHGLKIGYTLLVIEWLWLFIIGYIQWFILLPRLSKRLKKMQS